MSVNLIMRPEQAPISWEKFCEEALPFSIALDGYVNQGPRFQKEGPRANFNHHEEVDRLATRATCSQVLMAIRQGLYKCFRNGKGPELSAYANDCDEDVCLSWFLLKYGYLAEHTMNPLLNRLVSLTDMMDTTAGAYPLPSDMPILQEMAWAFEPYRNFRLGGQLSRRDPAAFASIVTDVENRIMRHITGSGQKISLDTAYETIARGKDGWTMVKEIGTYSRTGMFADNIQAYVSVRKRHDGNKDVTIGRMSIFIPFDVPKIIERLNQEENLIDNGDQWGGGNTIGGSPRIGGTKLTNEKLFEIIEEEVRELQRV